MRAEPSWRVRAEIKKLSPSLIICARLKCYARKASAELMKEEKVLDSLREKKEADHKGHILSEEQKDMDEIASRRDTSAQAH
jgi:hypothetical protein